MRRIKTIKTKVFIAVTFSLLLVGLISSLLKFSTALVVAQGGGSPQNVVWTNVVNATATGNTLQKTSGCDGCPDAGATSQQTITSGDGYMEFTVGTVTGQRFAGLSNDNPGTGWQEIDFAFRLWGVAASGNLDVQENGTYRYLGATYVAGDVLRVAVESGAVKYYKNGVLLYTSTVAPVYPLQVDTSLLDANSAVNNAVISTAFPGGSGNQISNINVAVNCNTSALINFSTSAASRAFVEYGPTTSYGSSTIDDPVRFYTEHAIQLTGLSANTTYHYRITANSNGITQSSDQSFTTASSGATCTALPAQVDSRMPDMTGAVERTIKTSGGHYTPSQFQTALNDAGTASEKRIITVDAGLTLSGQWTLPANADQNWIVIRTSQHAQLPEGKRVAPADASKLFKIQNTSVDPTLLAAAAANHIRIIGAEITIDPSALGDAPGGANQAGLIQLYTNLANNASNIPKFIGFDRCYVHGLPTKNTGRGLHATWEDSFVIDSYFDEFHFSGADGQAILFLDAKRNKILNNTLIGVGENFMWGGDALRIDNYVIGQLEFLRNHLYVPCKWKPDGGCGDTFTTDWTAEKNLFECKTCAKLFVFGNYLGGTTDAQGGFWPDGQSLAINLKLEQNSGRVSSVTVTNGGSGYTSPPTVSFTHVPGCVHGNCVQATATVSGGQVTNVNITSGKNGLGYCLAPTVSFSGGGGTGAAATANIAGALELMEDIVWYKNFMKNVHAGTAVVGHTITGAGNCGITPDRVLFKDNLFEIDDVVWDPEPGASSGTWGATGWFLGGTQNLQIIHNTIINANAPQASSCGSLFNDGSLILVGDPVTPKWSGFVFKDNVIDYRGCGISGSGAINHANNALANQFTGFVVTNNGIMRTGGEASNWPGVQLWATSWTSRLLNFNSGRDGNYRLANGTAWKNAAGDGKDLGADVDGVEGATANAPTGNWPSP